MFLLMQDTRHAFDARIELTRLWWMLSTPWAMLCTVIYAEPVLREFGRSPAGTVYLEGWLLLAFGLPLAVRMLGHGIGWGVARLRAEGAGSGTMFGA